MGDLPVDLLEHDPPTAQRWLKRRGAEILGWTLVAVGAAALVLPGPGLLLLVAGFALLATRYTWARNRLLPLKARAIRLAIKGVSSWPKIIGSVIGALGITALGVLWVVQPAVPGWWPLDARWWLFGGWGTGITLILSGVIALAMVAYSYRRIR